MPMRWRRIVDTAAFVLAVTLAIYVKYGLEGSWYAAIALAVIVYIPTPFILSRVWAIFSHPPHGVDGKADGQTRIVRT
jgi:hypothetical protein